MSDKATARALATRAHPSLLEQIRPEHVHLRAYARSENAILNQKQQRWLRGYNRFGDEMEAAFAQASGKNPRLVAESAATHLADPWMMRGMLHSEASPPLLAVFENLRGLSKKHGSKLLHDSPPEVAIDIMEWLGRYDIMNEYVTNWAAAISSFLMFDGLGFRAIDRRGAVFTWAELFQLSQSGVTPGEVREFYRAYKTDSRGVMRHLVYGDSLDSVLDRNSLGLSVLYSEYVASKEAVRSHRDGFSRLPMKSTDGIHSVGPGRYEDEVLAILQESSHRAKPDGISKRNNLSAEVSQKLDDPWKAFGKTVADVPENFRLVWDSLRGWPGRFNMVSLLDVPLSREDAERYAEWLDGVSSCFPGSAYASWEGFVLAAAAEKAAALQGPFGYRSWRPYDIDREALYRIMEASDPMTVGMAMFREELTAEEVHAHIVDGIPMDYVLAMR